MTHEQRDPFAQIENRRIGEWERFLVEEPNVLGGLEQPRIISETERASPGLDDELWNYVERVLLAHHHQPDLEGARVLYSAVAAHSLPGTPVWPMIVAPPGSMKTDLLTALDSLPGIHLIDRLTPNTFLSGQINDPKRPRPTSASLLHRIGPSGIIVYSDFSTVTSMNRDNRAGVLADMRRIYDGNLRREFGTAENLSDRQWHGRITFVVAATPEIDRYYSVFQVLGERFVMTRWHRPGGTEAAVKAMNQNKDEAQRDLKVAVHRLLTAALEQREPKISRNVQEMIAALAEFAVRGRTHVPRDGYRKEIIYSPEPEAPTRLGQQLAQLTKGSALLGGRTEVGVADFRLAQRAALDSIPAVRRNVLDTLIEGRTVNEAPGPKSTVHYAVEELQCQGLLEGEGLSSLSVRLLDRSCVKRR